MNRRSDSPKGLTFIEVLIGLSVFSLIMLGGVTLIQSMVRAHYTVETNSLFDRHVEGTGKLLETLAVASGFATQTPGPQYRWERSPVSRWHTLSFRIDREIPLFVSELNPLPPLTAFLEFDPDNEQFWLAWYPDVQFTENRRRLHYTLLSPWAAEVELGYYLGPERGWEFDSLSSGSRTHGNRRPNRIDLVFERAGQSKRHIIHLGEGQRHVLLY